MQDYKLIAKVISLNDPPLGHKSSNIECTIQVRYILQRKRCQINRAAFHVMPENTFFCMKIHLIALTILLQTQRHWSRSSNKLPLSHALNLNAIPKQNQLALQYNPALNFTSKQTSLRTTSAYLLFKPNEQNLKARYERSMHKTE